MTFSSVGVGSTQHLTGELFKDHAYVKLTHVAYRGGGMQPLTSLMSGRIDLMIDTTTVTSSAIKAGRRAAGVAREVARRQGIIAKFGIKRQ